MKPSRITLRCWPTDLDLNFHMNNGRYLSIMDLGRMDLMLQSGLAKRIMLDKKWMPVIAAGTVRYRKSIEPFERFHLETRVVGWDDNFVYLDQRFLSANGRVKAAGLVQAAMTNKSGRVPTKELMAAFGVDDTTDGTPPAYIKEWVTMLGDWRADFTRDEPQAKEAA